jgi:FAD synthase
MKTINQFMNWYLIDAFRLSNFTEACIKEQNKLFIHKSIKSSLNRKNLLGSDFRFSKYIGFRFSENTEITLFVVSPLPHPPLHTKTILVLFPVILKRVIVSTEINIHVFSAFLLCH